MRLFVAVPLIEKIVQELEPVLRSLPNPTKNLHFTLKFLGDISENQIKEIIEVLSEVKQKPFKARLDGLGTFGNRIIWAGVKNNPEFDNLINSVQSVLNRFKKENYVKPVLHVTLCRLRKPFKLKSKEFVSSEFVVNRFVLYQSTLTNNGPVYTKLKTFSLVN